MKAITVDLNYCNGCYACQIACKDEHVANDWKGYAKPQPNIGHFWLKLDEKVRGTIPKVKVAYRPHICMHCGHCIESCKNKAIYQRDDGLVIIDPDKCKGCMTCVDVCPYDAIYYNKDLLISQKCTGCAHLLDNGYALPRCVEICPTDAIKFGDETELAGSIKGATVFGAGDGTSPKVYYRNIPGNFIGGLVYDPIEEEVVIGAECIATSGGLVRKTATDNYGDFWFNELPAGKYDVVIRAPGFEIKSICGVDAEKSVNLGDIPLAKK